MPTAYDQRINEHGHNWQLLRDYCPEQTRNCISARIAVAEATAAGVTIWEYGGRGIGDVQEAYQQLLDWIERVQQKEMQCGAEG